MSNTSLQRRLDKLDGGRARPDPHGISSMPDDELEERILTICQSVVSCPESTIEDRSDATATINSINADRRARSDFWTRPDIAKIIAAKIAAGPENLKKPEITNGAPVERGGAV